MENKQDLFISWLCGKTDKFPFFQSESKNYKGIVIEREVPIGWRKEAEMKYADVSSKNGDYFEEE